MFDKKLMKRLKEEGVDPAVILKIMLEDDEEKQETPAAAADPAPAPSTEPAPAKPAETPQPAGVTNDAILAAIEKLTGAIHANGIRSASAGDPETAETTDEILAKMLRPERID